MSDSRIKSLDGLKLLALGVVFWIHAWLPDCRREVAILAMHVFFLCSGFCIARQHWQNLQWTGLLCGLTYVKSFLKRMYPLYACVLCVCVLSGTGSENFGSPMYWFDLLFNAFLVQAWGSGARLPFTFVGWFFSAFVFCYLLAPSLLALVRRMRSPALLAAVFLSCSFLLEFLSMKYEGAYFPLVCYSSPLSRVLEFGSAMCLYPVAMSLRRTFLHGMVLPLVMSVAEGVLLLGMVLGPVFCSTTLLATVGIVWTQILILVLVYEGGFFSKGLGSAAFTFLSRYELELFTLHQPMLGFVGLGAFARTNVNLSRCIAILAIVGLAVVYGKFLSKPLGQAWERGVDVFLKRIFRN